MKINNVKFVRFFVGDKEFDLPIQNIVGVNLTADDLAISIKVLNSNALDAIISFFKTADENPLFFICSDEKKENEIISVLGSFKSSSVLKGICRLSFKREHEG